MLGGHREEGTRLGGGTATAWGQLCLQAQWPF